MKYKQQYTPVRFSHLTSYASIGSIVRGVEDKLMAITDIRYWTDRSKNISAEIIPYVTRVSMALGIHKELRMPPTANENEKGELKGSYLPAVIFPTYAVCKKCRLLHNNPWRDQNKKFEDKVICNKCGCTLEQVTWCAVSSRGDLDDVPWHSVCHLNCKHHCKEDYETPYLKLQVDKNGRCIVKCDECKCSEFYENRKIGFIRKSQPWIFEGSSPLDEGDVVSILQVNDPSVFFPERDNALVIPPESRMSKTSVIDKLYNNSKVCREIDKIKIPLLRNGKIKSLATKFRCSIEEINDAFGKLNAGYPFFDDNLTFGELFEDEYKAFLTPLEEIRDDEDFVIEHKTEQWHELSKVNLSDDLSAIIKMVDKQMIAKRLREIQVFKGFYRNPQENNKTLVPPDIVGESNWLPAIELFGEGFFFTLNETLLSKWEKIYGVKKRADEIAKRYEKSEVTTFQDLVITPRFLLLHTLSHLLIRELESTSGYPAASLKERIYCSRDRKMAGILIYTAVADIVGSLGGIIESAEPKEFLNLMDGVFKHAQWCSLDPVCTEHEGQGPGWLNRAACHACSLIPEPSCQYNNIFLDRVFIKGSKRFDIPNFLNFIMRES
ncbi:MAG: DUF1998 domain-containing protein [Desulfamplus sp.]|nr:DUF1998 domain-containing protein [Desulfamplus sp.]